jgi:hypothetical protein
MKVSRSFLHSRRCFETSTLRITKKKKEKGLGQCLIIQLF